MESKTNAFGLKENWIADVSLCEMNVGWCIRRETKARTYNPIAICPVQPGIIEWMAKCALCIWRNNIAFVVLLTVCCFRLCGSFCVSDSLVSIYIQASQTNSTHFKYTDSFAFFVCQFTIRLFQKTFFSFNRYSFYFFLFLLFSVFFTLNNFFSHKNSPVRQRLRVFVDFNTSRHTNYAYSLYTCTSFRLHSFIIAIFAANKKRWISWIKCAIMKKKLLKCANNALI